MIVTGFEKKDKTNERWKNVEIAIRKDIYEFVVCNPIEREI